MRAKKAEYKIAERLKAVKNTLDNVRGNSEAVSHLWLSQVIAYDLGLKGNRGYKFSKICGYNYNITL
jgi:hypothetical protein